MLTSKANTVKGDSSLSDRSFMCQSIERASAVIWLYALLQMLSSKTKQTFGEKESENYKCKRQVGQSQSIGELEVQETGGTVSKYR